MKKQIEISEEDMSGMYRIMLKIRKTELEIARRYMEDEMKTPVHLCIGQEAVAAGVCINLTRDDYLFSNHRGHGHYIAKGGDIKSMIAELYNRETGCSRGRGGSMHLADPDAGMPGFSSIVGGCIPIATGTALASRMKGDGRVSTVFFGDGAVEEGVLYESANFASLKKLPVIYVCENNSYAVCSPLKNRQPDRFIHLRLKGLSLPSESIDGNDALEVYRTAQHCIKRARSGEGPSFIECRTYRMKDHHGIRDGTESGYRTSGELEYWENRCPVRRMEMLLTRRGLLDESLKESIEKETAEEIESAFDYAVKSPLPLKEDIMKYLYK